MALRSDQSFLKLGLFLGSYCQQLLIILLISTGQQCGAGMRYPERQSVNTSIHILLTFYHDQACRRRNFSFMVLKVCVAGLYLSPPHHVSVGCSCLRKVSFLWKRPPTIKSQSSRRHSLWCSDLKTAAGGSIEKVSERREETK